MITCTNSQIESGFQCCWKTIIFNNNAKKRDKNLDTQEFSLWKDRFPGRFENTEWISNFGSQ